MGRIFLILPVTFCLPQTKLSESSDAWRLPRILGQNSDSFSIGTISLSVVFSWTAAGFANTSISTSECLKLDFFLYASFIKDKSVKLSNLNYYFVLSICLQVSFEGNSLNAFTIILLLWFSSFAFSSKLTTLYFTSLNCCLNPAHLESLGFWKEVWIIFCLSMLIQSPIPFLKPSVFKIKPFKIMMKLLSRLLLASYFGFQSLKKYIYLPHVPVTDDLWSFWCIQWANPSGQVHTPQTLSSLFYNILYISNLLISYIAHCESGREDVGRVCILHYLIISNRNVGRIGMLRLT